jgi:group I intron endonuclease
MIGIYKITNKNNGMCYIGKSIDIKRRWQGHKEDSFCSEERWKLNKRGEQTHFHRALRKYGIDAFSWEIIEECSLEQLNEKEKYWIEYYDSINTGYNMTFGGDGYSCGGGENAPGAKITQEECNIIKEKLKLRWTTAEIQTLVPAATSGMVNAINYGRTWYDENEDYPLCIHQGHRKWSDEEAMIIKKEYAKGATILQLAEKYSSSQGTIENLVFGKSYTNLPILEREVDWKRISKNRFFSDEEVRFYRNLAKEKSMLSIYNEYKIKCNYVAFRNMIKGITYKNVEL